MATISDRFTREDYLRLPEGFPAQLVEGLLVKEPSPVPWHQWISRRLLLAFAGQLGEDRVLHAPTDLFLDDENIYQPDLMAFEHPLRIGPEDREVPRPVLVLEVLSPSTASYDLGVKARRYLAWGVAEVWLVDPQARTVEIRSRGGSTLRGIGETAESGAVPGLRIELARLFRT